nr:hypothetical protein Iba_chr03aCG1520 [Ipomoea batatas]
MAVNYPVVNQPDFPPLLFLPLRQINIPPASPNPLIPRRVLRVRPIADFTLPIRSCLTHLDLLCSASSNAGAASPSVSLSFFHPSLIESPVVKQTSLAANLLELLILHSGENSVRTQISSLHNVESVNQLNEEDIPRFADSQGTEGGRQRRRLLASSSSACFFVADSQGREGGIGARPWGWLRRRRPSLWQLGGVRETEGWDSS